MPFGRLGAAAVLAVLGTAGALTALAAGREKLPVAAPLVVAAPFREVRDSLSRRETLSDLFARRGLDGPALYRALAAAPALQPRRLQPGQVFEFGYQADDSVPQRVRVRLDPERLLWMVRSPSGDWQATVEPIPWVPAPVRVIGRVRGSLYQSLAEALPDSVLPPAERDRLVDDLADGVFGWEVDFSRDLAQGDRFAILFERLQSSRGELRYGRLLAARLEVRGAPHTAYLLNQPDGRNAYYDAEGRSLRRQFKLAPVPYRITSRYSLSRLHPILRTWRAHLGVDYRAPIGAPVSATGDGTVLRAGRWGGYGLMVGIGHPNGIETRYAHLSRLARGIRVGVRVHQGDVIGYAGMSGLATAPHVHYEFLQHGRHRNPRRLDLGHGSPVPADRRAEFAAARAGYDRLLQDPAPRFLAVGGH